jgi:hypothetical protein
VAGCFLLKILSIHHSFVAVLRRYQGATILWRRKPAVGNSDVGCGLHGQGLRFCLLVQYGRKDPLPGLTKRLPITSLTLPVKADKGLIYMVG